MKTLTANWQNKETAIVYNGDEAIGKIEFENVNALIYDYATIHADGEIFYAEPLKGKDIIIKNGNTEIFTSAMNSMWGNYEVRTSGQDTGYDIKGKWFKPGTRFTDADDKDLVVVKSDPWTGKKMTIEVTETDISDLMILATLYHHIRASTAKTTAAIIATLG